MVIGVGLIALGAVVAWDAFSIRAGAGGYAFIGPRAFPYGIAFGLAVLGILTIVQAVKELPERPVEHFGPVLWIVGGLVAQAALLALVPAAGFSLATACVFAATAKAFGRGPLWVTYPLGVVMSLLIWLAFSFGLKLVLPTGFIESLF
jgi:putative tricarboxylic transport membrane protein